MIVLKHQAMRFNNSFLFFWILFFHQNLPAQSGVSLQDSTLNNLVHPKGYITCKPGELGSVKKTGTGEQSIILIAGLGFSADDVAKLMQERIKLFQFADPASTKK